MEYKEIFRLKEMLEKANIPFQFREVFTESEYMKGYQICYPALFPNDCKCSVVEHGGSYGHEADLLEIMGLLTKKESKHNSVCGSLTAENVFKRIKRHYKGVMKN